MGEMKRFLSSFSYMKFSGVHLVLTFHCVKSVRIWSYSGPYFPAFGQNTERYGGISPYSVQIRENTDQNFEYGHFSRSVFFIDFYLYIPISIAELLI